MKNYFVQYTMKPEYADENAALLRAYLDELEQVRPANMAYAINRMDNGTGFFHLVQSASGAAPFSQLPNYRNRADWAVGKYTEEPVLVGFSEIGAYRNL